MLTPPGRSFFVHFNVFVILRCKISTTRSTRTNDLAYKLRDALAAELGEAPKIVTNELHKKYLDPNMEQAPATFGEPIPTQAYIEYHASIRAAIASSPAPALLLAVGGYSDTSTSPVDWTMFGTYKRLLT